MKERIVDIVENSKVTHPIALAAQKGNQYWTDFLRLTEDYRQVLCKQDYSSFLSKSRLDCEISMAEYLQFASEATIVDYIIRKYEEFKYEPRYNNKKNPECSFRYGGRTINIEVKCPNLFKRMNQEKNDGIKLYAAERFPDKQLIDQAMTAIETGLVDGQHAVIIDRLDNKLKDFLISAHKKFPTSSHEYFNVLAVALDIVPDLDDWYSYLFGWNGAFTHNSYISEDYSNVDAILLTNVQHGHMSDEIDLNHNCWNLENYISLLFLDPRKELCDGFGEFYFNVAIDLFGRMTRDFLCFQQELDIKNQQRERMIRTSGYGEEEIGNIFAGLYIDDKIKDLRIISEWVDTKKTMPKS